MGMFCYQCQETARGQGCTVRGVCGKTADVAQMQDLLLYVIKGISYYTTKARELGLENEEANRFIVNGLFSTITNANFDKDYFVEKVKEGLALREEVKEEYLKAGGQLPENLPEAAAWRPAGEEEFAAKAEKVGYWPRKMKM